MRKMLMALVAMFAMAGLVIAVEVTVVAESYDKEKKTIKVKEGDKEKTYTVSDKAKFTTTDQKGENSKEAKLEDFEKRVTGKGGKNGIKLDITTDGDKITEAKWKQGKGKN